MDALPPLTATIVCVGSLNVDLVVYAAALPLPGETLTGSRFEQFHGGKGANQSAAAAALAPRGAVAHAGAVGADAFGAAYVAALAARGVDVSCVAAVAGAATGVAAISVDARGENCIVVVPGANALVAPRDAAAAVARAPRARAVLAQLEVPLAAVEAALRAAAAARAPAFLTPAPAPREGLADGLLALASVLVPNAREAAELAGGAGAGGDAAEAAAAAGAALVARGARAVAVTLGPAGVALAGEGGRAARVRAPRVAAPLDTTGAGDCFAGALAFFYAELAAAPAWGAPAAPAGAPAGGGEGGAPRAAPVDWRCLVEAARRAAYVAAVSVTRRGAQASYAARSDLPAALFEFESGAPADVPEEVGGE